MADEQDVPLLDPRKVRREHHVRVDLGDGTAVLARREDLTVLVFEGRIPMPLLAAVQKMIDMPEASPADRIMSLGEAAGRDLVRVLREHVCAVVLQPRVTMEESGDPDTVPVSYFDIQQLMAIWTATAVVARVTPAGAARFRRGTEPDDPVVPHLGEDVRPTPELVVVGGPDVRPDIEYVGR